MDPNTATALACIFGGGLIGGVAGFLTARGLMRTRISIARLPEGDGEANR